MRFKLLLIVLVSILVASPASAQKLSGIGANLFGNNYFSFAKVNLQQAPVSTISVGPLKVKLQSTRLADIKKRFGGTVMSNGDATWLCYHLEGANVWFLSNPLGGQEFVMIVGVEASAKMPDGCEAAPEGFALPDLGIPGLGAATAELKEAFGAASGGKVGYRHDRPGGYADIAQYIGYMLKGGKVSGYGVGETSVPTAH